MTAAETAMDALAYYQELTAALMPRENETPHTTVRRLLGNFREADTESCTLLAAARTAFAVLDRDAM